MSCATVATSSAVRNTISGASDRFVSSPNVFWAIYQAETRKGVEGVLDAAQRMPREAMLFAYTCNPARALNQLDKIGSLAPGMQADLVLVDRDVLTDSSEELKDTKVCGPCLAVSGLIAHSRDRIS